MHDALTIRWMTSPATPHPDDLRLFLTVVRRGGFPAAATELGLSTVGVSKRVRLLEAQPRRCCIAPPGASA